VLRQLPKWNICIVNDRQPTFDLSSIFNPAGPLPLLLLLLLLGLRRPLRLHANILGAAGALPLPLPLVCHLGGSQGACAPSKRDVQLHGAGSGGVPAGHAGCRQAGWAGRQAGMK
jgi:hypothetical protein